MAIFRCKRSGNLMTVLVDSDIAKMRQHQSYEEVDPPAKIEDVPVFQMLMDTSPRKKMGRPRKVA